MTNRPILLRYSIFMLKNEADILRAIEADAWRMEVIHAAAQLALPQWIIGAGFVRNFVWDIQHGRTPSRENNDVDLIYFNKDQDNEQLDQQYEQKLREIRPDINWEVTNQAHVHTYNDPNNPPYTSAEDSLAHWTETATCTGVTLEDGRLRLIAPWGVDDLLQLKLRIPPCHEGKEIYKELFGSRITQKNWLQTWPELRVVD